jgi:hypothetical protein
VTAMAASPGDTVSLLNTPTWAKLIDFETTLPSAVEELIRQRDERQRA